MHIDNARVEIVSNSSKLIVNSEQLVSGELLVYDDVVHKEKVSLVSSFRYKHTHSL